MKYLGDTFSSGLHVEVLKKISCFVEKGKKQPDWYILMWRGIVLPKRWWLSPQLVQFPVSLQRTGCLIQKWYIHFPMSLKHILIFNKKRSILSLFNTFELRTSHFSFSIISSLMYTLSDSCLFPSKKHGLCHCECVI